VNTEKKNMEDHENEEEKKKRRGFVLFFLWPEGRGERWLVLFLLVITLGLSYLAFVYDRSLWSTLVHCKTIGWIKSESALKRRHAATLSWTPIHNEDDICSRDIVYIPAETKASAVLADKRLIELPADAMVQFLEAAPGENEIAFLDGNGDGSDFS
jgi:hypothetical protein